MDYGYLYHLMFNAATDAVEYIDKGETDLARLRLVLAQMKAEEDYITMAENEEQMRQINSCIRAVGGL